MLTRGAAALAAPTSAATAFPLLRRAAHSSSHPLSLSLSLALSLCLSGLSSAPSTTPPSPRPRYRHPPLIYLTHRRSVHLGRGVTATATGLSRVVAAPTSTSPPSSSTSHPSPLGLAMNFIRQLSSQLLPSSDSSSSSSSSASSSSSTPSSVSVGAVDVDGCTGCLRPCAVHPSLPSYLKIDGGDMSDSVKPHRRHLCVAQGVSATQWPNEVTDPAGSYLRLCGQLLFEAEGKIGYPVRLSAASAKTRAEVEEEQEEEERGMDEEQRSARKAERDARREDFADLHLYPDRLLFRSISRDALPAFIRAVFVEDRGRFRMLSPHGHVDVEADRQAAAAAAVVEVESGGQGSGAAALDLEFPYELIPGLSVLICAHKQRDKRCGIAGPLLQAELQKEVEERRATVERHAELSEAGHSDLPPAPAPLVPIHTLLISHTGGHKYAGNVIVYPGGVWYGRFNPCHVHVLLDGHASPSLSTAKEQREKLEPLRRGEVQLDW